MEYRRTRGAGKAGATPREKERGERSSRSPLTPPNRRTAEPSYAFTTPDSPTSFPCPPDRSTPRLSNTSGASLSTSG